MARSLMLVLGASALLVAGCGDSGGSADTSSSNPASPAQTPAATTTESQSSATASGKAIFASAGCAACHTFAAADAQGRTGPNLDQSKPGVAEVVEQVTNGGGGMPTFQGRLTTEQIQTLAQYVAANEAQ